MNVWWRRRAGIIIPNHVDNETYLKPPVTRLRPVILPHLAWSNKMTGRRLGLFQTSEAKQKCSSSSHIYIYIYWYIIMYVYIYIHIYIYPYGHNLDVPSRNSVPQLAHFSVFWAQVSEPSGASCCPKHAMKVAIKNSNEPKKPGALRCFTKKNTANLGVKRWFLSLEKFDVF